MNNDNPLIFRNQPSPKQLHQQNIYTARLNGMMAMVTFAVIGTQSDILSLQRDTYAFILTVGVLIVYGVIFLRSFLQTASSWKSYTIIWDDLTITRQFPGYKDLVLYHGEITEISQMIGGRLVIRGERPNDFLLIPATIENRDELIQLLAAIKPIEVYKASNQQTVKTYLNLGACITFLISCALFQETRIILLIALPLNALDAYFRITNPQVPNTNKFFAALRVMIISLLLISSYIWSFNYFIP